MLITWFFVGFFFFFLMTTKEKPLGKAMDLKIKKCLLWIINEFCFFEIFSPTVMESKEDRISIKKWRKFSRWTVRGSTSRKYRRLRTPSASANDKGEKLIWIVSFLKIFFFFLRGNFWRGGGGWRRMRKKHSLHFYFR